MRVYQQTLMEQTHIETAIDLSKSDFCDCDPICCDVFRISYSFLTTPDAQRLPKELDKNALKLE